MIRLITDISTAAQKAGNIADVSKVLREITINITMSTKQNDLSKRKVKAILMQSKPSKITANS